MARFNFAFDIIRRRKSLKIIIILFGLIFLFSIHQYWPKSVQIEHSLVTDSENTIENAIDVDSNQIEWDISKLNNQKMVASFEDSLKTAMESLSLTQIPLEKITRILIISRERSGSTFLGELLQQAWPTIGIFEPLRKLSKSITNKKFSQWKKLGEVSRLVELYKCEIAPYLESHMGSGKFKDPHREHVVVDSIIEKISAKDEFDHESLIKFSNQICLMSEHIMIKELTLNIIDSIKMENLLFPRLVNANNPFHVLFLVRDPRAIISSRMEVKERNTANKWNLDPSFICQESINNINGLREISRQKTSNGSLKINLVRYEDLTSQPIQYSKKLFSLLSLNFTPKVEKWIVEHTQGVGLKNNFFSIFRDAKTRIIRWSSRLDSNVRRNIERECDQVMNLLGYKALSNQSDVNLNQSIIPDFNDVINQEYPLQQYSIHL